jgi:hypothetical protein
MIGQAAYINVLPGAMFFFTLTQNLLKLFFFIDSGADAAVGSSETETDKAEAQPSNAVPGTSGKIAFNPLLR